MIVLDTSILVYAVGGDHPLREPCRSLLRAHASGQVQAATTLEVIQEFVHVRARRRPRADAVALGHSYLTALHIITIEKRDLELGLTYFEHTAPLGCFDCILAALTVNRHAQALVSADRAFAQVPGLPWVDAAHAHPEAFMGGRE